ncbi:MAG: hypothetical protein U5J83_13050 [Bryobacterales bacterium]|nr:hypothetical protein [Bryobacterales bacterium]
MSRGGIEAFRDRQRTSVSSAGLAEFRFAQASSREAAKQLERALSSLRNKIAAQQKAFLHARRNYELVLRLREKRYAEWLREANRQEEADATESYLGRFTQRRFALNSRTPVRLASPGEIPLPSEEPAGVR